MQPTLCADLRQCLISSAENTAHLPVVEGAVVINRTSGSSKLGKYVILQLCSRTQMEIGTGRGRLTQEARLRRGKEAQQGKTKTVIYKFSVHVEPDFGEPGAVLVMNGSRHKFFLCSVTLTASDSRRIHVDCNSWVYPISKTKGPRLFFSNTSYLPRETPAALQKLRAEELESLRGDGTGERRKWERIYDYDLYNDLGDPDRGPGYARTVLGGSEDHPYPRRGRTGRPPSDADPKTESRPGLLGLDVFLPPDERFSPSKMSEFVLNSIQAVVHFLIPELKSLTSRGHGDFESFDQLTEDLYSDQRRRPFDRKVINRLKHFLPVISEDEELGREMISGLNPAVIRRLEVFPPTGRGGSRSSITTSQVEKNLDGLTLQKAMKERRIFILDHHDYLMPYLARINMQGVCIYASRTLLFLQADSTMKPVAIELSLPGEAGGEINRVFLPARDGIEGALWQLAKAHVAVNDSGHHQLISHWLKTHAAVEPFIVATRRQLSTMHPVYKLLEPHFKDTMQINALARSVLLNAGGVLEKTMFPRKLAMEISSAIYRTGASTSRPCRRISSRGILLNEIITQNQIISQGMAIEDPGEPSGVRLLFEDYPYAADGLEIWTAIKRWISNFCSVFYSTDDAMNSDVEIQAWWSEIREVGHGDKRGDGDWRPMNSLPDLVEALTTLIWIASALHAAVHPRRGTAEFAEFMADPDKFFLTMLPDRFTTTLGLALIEVLSRHTSDEVYLGQRPSPEWTDHARVRQLFEEFRRDLLAVEGTIRTRNSTTALRNRRGPAEIPYTLLHPDTSNVRGEGGITGRGIPNSVSI
ncbi:unnamed protein product [Spirodela intermedia]|uniref:Lipoxygenase n=1 Tax=Spirodela intermedia TaxID=51605 RepID=A0A7I8IQI0_SPIIN|nr:unnamed protein product [Spirodela intermedia]CAA6660131.1 unnamed protein product [Spirodela intermedia]